VKTINEKLQFIRGGSRTLRFHTHPRIFPETVGHHTDGALGLLFLITEGQASQNLIWALRFHDTGERIMGDLPSPAKQGLGPAFKQMFDEQEDALCASYGLRFHLNEEEGFILKMCDNLDGLFSCIDECRRGNKDMELPLANYLAYCVKMLNSAYEEVSLDAEVPDYLQRSSEILNIGASAAHRILNLSIRGEQP